MQLMSMNQEQTADCVLHQTSCRGNGADKVVYARYTASMAVCVLIALALYSANAAAQAKPHSNAPRSTKATLNVWVPGGFIGDKYWIYINGEIASAPPHSAIANVQTLIPIHPDSNPSQPISGYELWDKDGFVFRMRNEDFDGPDTLQEFMTGKGKGVFQKTSFKLRPGMYTVDVLMAHESSTSYPFSVTHKYYYELEEGTVSNAYIAVPNTWSDPKALSSGMRGLFLCSSGSKEKPDADLVERELTSINNDPVVKEFMGLKPPPATERQTAILYLPDELGGTREYDGEQLRLMAKSIQANHNHYPQHDEVADCRMSLPQYAPIYDNFDVLINSIERLFRSFDSIAASFSSSNNAHFTQ